MSINQILSKTVRYGGMEFLITYRIVNGKEEQISVTNLTKERSEINKNYEEAKARRAYSSALTYNTYGNGIG